MFWNQESKTNVQSENTLTAIQDKWQNIALSTKPIQLTELEKNINKLYKLLGYTEQKIVFYSSPYQLWEEVINFAFQDFPETRIEEIENFCRKKLKQSKQGFIKDLIIQIVNILKKQLEFKLAASLKLKIEQILLDNSSDFNQTQIQINKETVIQLNNPNLEKGLTQNINQLEIQLNSELLIYTLQKIASKIKNNAIRAALTQICTSLSQNKSTQFLSTLGGLFGKSLFTRNYIAPELWIFEAINKEYHHLRNKNIISSFFDSKEWKIFRDITSNCGWFLPYENICFVCDRPQKLRLNRQFHYHAEGQLAISFRDGRGLYAYEGVILPNKYGELKPENWEPKWILEEENSELRRVLIQGLGYDKIAEELEAEEVDSWREYTILRFNNIIDDIDGQPICLLKMICPSTQFIHALRIPPDINSAREAIQWVNWGIDPTQIIMAS